MEEPLLTSLCTICYIDPPKYTCPRCLAATCSLSCSKRHKLWSSCNGIRDPTVYKPMCKVATPAGIDHDYNFLHSIEHGISRSEKVLIEDLGLVSREELRLARTGESERQSKRKLNEAPGEVLIRKVAQEKNIQILRAPKGMRRNQENTTTWNRKRKTVDWQVEWIQKDSLINKRFLYKVSGVRPIRDQYNVICQEERLMNMTVDEKRKFRKRKAQEYKVHSTKKRKMELESDMYSPTASLQDAETKTWSLKTEMVELLEDISADQVIESNLQKHHLYIHRPCTPASFPTVIALLDTDQCFTEILTDRCILEFPTIYVLDKSPSDLPEGFMLEKEYLDIINKNKPDAPLIRRATNNSDKRDLDEESTSSLGPTAESRCETDESSSCSSSDDMTAVNEKQSSFLPHSHSEKPSGNHFLGPNKT